MTPLVHYHLNISEEGDVLMLHVTGETTSPVKQLYMDHSFAENLPDGHATFVRNLTLRDAINNDIVLVGGGKNGWKVTDLHAPTPWKWGYSIVLTHETLLPPSMRDETPHRTGDYSFWTGWAVFILPDGDFPFVVDVDSDETVTTVWQEDQAVARRYFVTDTDQLVQAFLIFGDHAVSNWVEEGCLLKLTVQGEWRAHIEMLRNAITSVFTSMCGIFGDVPMRRVMVSVETVTEDVLRGGVIGCCVSACMPFLGEETEALLPFWGSFVAHELFHLWNGNSAISMITDGVPEYWFIEGFTVYYQDVIALRQGWITPEKYIQNCEWSWKQYSTYALPLSLRAASGDKSKHAVLVYDGGRLVALLLNHLIDQRTNSEHNLETLMRLLYIQSREQGALSIDHVASNTAAITGMPLAEAQQWLRDRLANVNSLKEVDFVAAIASFKAS